MIAALTLTLIFAQVPDAATLRGEVPQTRKRLTELEAQLRAGKGADLLDELLKLLDEAGDDLVSADGKQFVPARRYVHRFLSQLPADALKRYQDRVEAPARKLLDAGRADRDARPLRQLLDRYFASRPGAEALNLLGELLLERGDGFGAENCWRRLTPDVVEGDFPHPTPPADLARTRAKLVLAILAQGDRTRAESLIAAIRKDHPDAAGALAGREGRYADTLAPLAAKPIAIPSLEVGPGSWNGLGGDADRGGHVDGRFAATLPSRPTWATDIPVDGLAQWDRYPAKPPPVGAARSVAFHPVVLGDTAYLADAGRVIAFDRATGQAHVAFDLRREEPFAIPAGDMALPTRFEADYALAVEGDSLYARLGAVTFGNAAPGARNNGRASFLVALDTGERTLVARWKVTPPTRENAPAFWEGCPVVAAGRVIAGFLRLEPGRPIHAAAAYDAADGRLLWTTELSEPVSAEPRTRQELCTVAGPNAIFCTHTGAIVALDVRTGKPAWAYRYPRLTAKPRGDGRHRDIGPPVAAAGRVFVAPTDSEQLLALDAETGKPLWKAGPLEVNQLAGVADGKLVAVIAGPVRGVRAFDIATGSTDAPRGWVNHDDPGLSAFGRGLLSESTFLWPTQAGLFALRMKDGTPSRQPIRGPHGNLAFAAGTLFVATPTQLWAYMLNPGATAPVPLNVVIGAAVPELVDRTPPSSWPGTLPRLTLPATAHPVPPEAESPVARTVVRVGDCHLASVDPKSGRVGWILDAKQRPRYDPFAAWTQQCFLPPLAAEGSRVVAQLGTGRRWLIDAANGAVVADQPGTAPEFAAEPARFADGSWLVATGPGSAACVDEGGRLRWQFAAPRPAGLRGRPMQLRTFRGTALVAAARNVGYELDALDAKTGRPLWIRPAFIPYDTAALAACDGSRLYIVLPGKLLAVRLDTGRTAWEMPLVGDGWRVFAAPNAIVAVPENAPANEPLSDVIARVANTFAARPDLRRLPGLATTLYDAWAERTAALSAFEPSTGRALGPLDCPAFGPWLSARAGRDGLRLTTAKQSYLVK